MGDKVGYTPLMRGSDDDGEDYDTGTRTEVRPARYRPGWTAVLNIVVLAVSVSCLVASSIMYSRASGSSDPLKWASYNSPVADRWQPRWTTKQEGTAGLDADESVYRRPPSAEVDAAWNRIADLGTIVITADDVRRIGKDPATTVRAPEAWGYGPDAHLAQVDGMHLVHCLNALRKGLHFNFPYYHPDGITFSYQAHLSHCLHAILNALTCRPSVDLITWRWTEKRVNPFPDFGVSHRCWDYDALLDWHNENRIPNSTERWEELTIPEGYPLFPIPDLLLETYNITREEAEAMEGPL